MSQEEHHREDKIKVREEWMRARILYVATHFNGLVQGKRNLICNTLE